MNSPNLSYNRSKTTTRFCLKCRENRQTTLSREDSEMESSFCLFLFSGPSGNIRGDYDAAIRSEAREVERDTHTSRT